MLVITRKIDQDIRISDTIRITVLEIRTGQIRLAIEAPDDVLIMRGELADRLTEDQIEDMRRQRAGRGGYPCGGRG